MRSCVNNGLVLKFVKVEISVDEMQHQAIDGTLRNYKFSLVGFVWENIK